jgi:hypothetical protein
MKHVALWLVPVVLLSACAVTDFGRGGPPAQGPPQYGYKPGESAPAVISETEFKQLTESLTDLYNQRATLARLVRTSPDAAARARYAGDIERMNASIAPMEYRMRAAGRPLPPRPRN